jgi:hypothetical protein
VKDNLYHDERMVFGEALVDAYNLEDKIVKYPRIMLRSDVAIEASANNMGELVRQADDGPMYLHVLGRELWPKVGDGMRG